MTTTIEPEAEPEGCILGVDFLDWANEWVGKECLRCGQPIQFKPLGMAGGQSENRIECGCTAIESRSKEH